MKNEILKIKNKYNLKLKNIFELFFLFSFCLFNFALAYSPAQAMGNKPPVKEQPKYKLEILKMEFVTVPSITGTTSTTTTTIIKATKHKKKH